MELSVQNLKVFEALTQLGNMTLAAKRLHMSQPAMSWSLQQMEERLGARLFVRTRKGMVLTKAGEILALHVRDLVNGWERVHSALQAGLNQAQGRYRLGVFQNLAMYALPRFFPELASNFPLIDLQLSHATSAEISEGVIQMKYDFGLVANPPMHPDLTIVDLYPDEVLFWVNKSPSDLQRPDNPFAIISAREGMLHGDFGYQEALRSGLICSTRTMPTSDLLVVVSLVRSGAAIGLLPRTIAESFGGDALTPLAGSPVKKDKISLIWRFDALQTTASQIIREHIVRGLKKRGNHGLKI